MAPALIGTPADPPANALSPDEREQVLVVLTEARFANQAVAQIWAKPLDQGIYLISQ